MQDISVSIKVKFTEIRTCTIHGKYYLFPYSTFNNNLGSIKDYQGFIQNLICSIAIQRKRTTKVLRIELQHQIAFI